MAKYDLYETSRTKGGAENETSRKLTVLFEIGDNVRQIIRRTDRFLDADEDSPELTSEEQLVALSEDEMVALMTAVWSAQMRQMGNEKYQYANELRAAINVAQNAN